jgi:hypothetical protein
VLVIKKPAMPETVAAARRCRGIPAWEDYGQQGIRPIPIDVLARPHCAAAIVAPQAAADLTLSVKGALLLEPLFDGLIARAHSPRVVDS